VIRYTNKKGSKYIWFKHTCKHRSKEEM